MRKVMKQRKRRRREENSKGEEKKGRRLRYFRHVLTENFGQALSLEDRQSGEQKVSGGTE